MIAGSRPVGRRVWLGVGVAAVAAVVATGASGASRAGTIATIAGTGTAGYSGDGGRATAAQLSGPDAVAVDGRGNVYIADRENNRVRRVSASGTITTIAGTGVAGFSGDGGPATAAQLNLPSGVAVDARGTVYIADLANNRVRAVNPAGTIVTIAGTGVRGITGNGGPATSAQLNSPGGVAVDGKGNVYFAEGARVRKVGSDGTITTVAGTGVRGFSGDGGLATAARLNGPEGVAVDALGSVYVADYSNSRVRKVSPAGTITTIAGNGRTGVAGDGGPANEARVSAPVGVAVDQRGNVYISDEIGQRVRMVGRNGTITTIAGTAGAGSSGDGGPATSARLNVPYGVAVDGNGDVYITEYTGNRVRKIRRPAAAAAPTAAPASAREWLYGADGSSALFRIDPVSGVPGRIGATGVKALTDIAFTPAGKLYGISFSRFYRLNPRTGHATPIGNGIGMGSVNALASDARGRLYVASTAGMFGTVNADTGRGTVVGSYGPGLGSSGDLVFSPDGRLFATAKRSGREVLLRVNPATGVASVRGHLGLTDVYGLAFGPGGKLLGAAQGNSPSPILVSIDPVTGRTRAIGAITNAQGMWGLATRTQSTSTPAVTAATSGYFKTPSGNIVCYHSPGPADLPRAFLGCGIKSGLKPAPPRRPCQDGDYAGDRVTLEATGRVRVPSCAGDAGALVGERRARVLAYGTTWSGGGLRCTSAATGLTCRNKSGHGFFLSRERWRAF